MGYRPEGIVTMAIALGPLLINPIPDEGSIFISRLGGLAEAKSSLPSIALLFKKTCYFPKNAKEERTMAIRKFFKGLAVASIFVIGIWLLIFVPQATAETLNFKFFNHVVKAEAVPIPDKEGHIVRLTQREGVFIFENGELGWAKTVLYVDLVKGAGPYYTYIMLTFQDGSTMTTYTKGVIEATPAGLQTGSKMSGEIIHGTGRFQGIKGTVSSTSKILPPEKGEPSGKAVGEGALVYTLPSK